MRQSCGTTLEKFCPLSERAASSFFEELKCLLTEPATNLRVVLSLLQLRTERVRVDIIESNATLGHRVAVALFQAGKIVTLCQRCLVQATFDSFLQPLWYCLPDSPVEQDPVALPDMVAQR